MFISSMFKSEPLNSKFAVQMLDAFDMACAIFASDGNLKFANSKWHDMEFIDGKFEDIFANKGSKDAIFRLAKALRLKRTVSEDLNDYKISISPLDNYSIVRIISFDYASQESDRSTKFGNINLLQKLNHVKDLGIDSNISSMIDNAPFGMARLSGRDVKNTYIIAANPAFVEIANLNSGSDLNKLVAPVNISMLDKLELGKKDPVEIILNNQDRNICDAWLVEDGKQAALILIDVTQKREMEGRLIQSNKMEAIGKIASEVAHELNNLLAVIVLNTDSLSMRHPVGDPSYQELQLIKNATGRAGNLVQTLLAFSRKQTLRREVLDISEVLSEFSYLLHQVLDERVKFDIHHGRVLPKVLADKQQLETLFMNLVTNARDAVLTKNSNGGTVNVYTRRANRDDIIEALKSDRVAVIPDIPFCQISVSDNGTGMTPETAKKVFEPFFTTKETGKGTGIGMASVYGIVKQSNGFIAFDTELGKGTTFSVYLPETKELPKDNSQDAIKNEDEKSDLPKAIAVKRANNLSGTGRILLVEDEDGLRMITSQLLKQRGYDVTVAEDGEVALSILEENPNGFDLVISDVIMPIMDGPSMLKAAKEYLGDARVIFMSGYAEQDFGKILENDRAISFLPKPFELVQLAEKVKQELNAI